MKPIEFEGVNKVFVAPPGLDAELLPIQSNADETMHTSCWELGDDEVAMLLATRRIHLTILTHKTRHPPVMLTVTNPQG